MIVQSPVPEIPIPDMALTPFVLERAAQLAGKPALIDGVSGNTITYGDLARAIRSTATGLAKRGFTKGDVFAICCPNAPEYAIAFHAVALLGGLVSPINPLYTGDEIEKQLEDASARCLLTIPALADKVFEAARRAGTREIYVLGEASGAVSFTDLLEDRGELPEVDIEPGSDVVALPYSSGTTGLSKGVMLTHRNLVANLAQLEAIGQLSDRDTLVCVLPMFHIYGMVVILNLGLRVGATIVSLPRFELEPFLRVLERYRVTFAPVVPPILLAMMKHDRLDGYDLGSLETIFSGAAPLGEELERACTERLGCATLQGWGLTESSPAITIRRRGVDLSKLGSVGPCLPNTEIRIVSIETGEAFGPRQEGEILARGPQMMKGYLNRPEATAQTLDVDGWLHTGDIGYVDEEGHLFIVDRLKELIKYKGFQVPPAELEALLISHPAVADAAVIPSPDEEAGEVPKAFVVLRGKATAEEILEFVASRVAPHKKIRLLAFVDQIPKSPSGKILRRVLIERDRQKGGKQ